MRKIIVLIMLFFVLSCDKKFKAPKPDVLIEQPVMEDILYDISLLKAAKSKKFKVLNDNNVNAGAFIYKKYKIDSIILRQNIEYYATNSFKTAKGIEERIGLKLKSEMTKVEQQIAVEKERVELKKVNDTLFKQKIKKLK